MGRRPKLKNNDKPENAIPSTEISEQQDVNGNINPTKVLDSQLENAIPSTEISEQQGVNGNINPTKVLDSQLENAHSVCSPQKHPNSSVAEVESAQEQTKQVSKHQKKYAKFTTKMSKYRNVSVRRSERIRSGVVKYGNSTQEVECIVDVVSDSEKDEPESQTEQVLPQPNPDTQTGQDAQIEQVLVLPLPNTQIEQALQEPNAEIEQLLLERELDLEPAENISNKGLDEKVDYALHKIEDLYKIIDLLKAKVGGNAALYEASSIAPISYRSMYIDSQKKLEALANENQLLNEQLENALSKVEMYEKENRALNELYDRLKDTVQQQLSNVAKSTEAATQEIDTAYSASAAKRKRIEG
ncbi:hypothetical protein L195_g009557 [Trifolium pratense]|uniref:Uncharacterized protein n=2 Tax=Trifolium pratense TaxID=57577 RepID=A0A2K3PC98_TRIPR|nr:uncharacterized protein LOC123889448 isoform X1 [Trifolium pratense]PNY12913.1 hypothetical protein L195_g009557 [Trifolium pratense]CAJ2633144.1 unnamed protein product [Trifolium pratense]